MNSLKKINTIVLLVAISWIVIVLISLFYNIKNIDKKYDKLALEHAKSSFMKDLMFRKWVAMHGGVYVFPTKKTPPNPYLKHMKDRDLYTTDGRMLTLMNPAYSLRELMDNFKGIYNERGHITSLNLLNPKNKPDKWERKALKKFEDEKIMEYSEKYNYQGEKHLRYMGALTVKSDCLKCHKQQGYKLGDVRGGISVTLPLTEYIKESTQEKEETILFHFLLLLATLSMGYIFYKRLKESTLREIELDKEVYVKEAILKEQSKMAAMGEMIGNIAHQWRQPLSVISTASSGMQMQKDYGILSDEELKKNCDLINTNAQFLSKTIDDFRNFIKGDRVKLKFNIDDMVDHFMRLMFSSMKDHHINIVVEIDKDIVIEGYENELLQCLINIFNNAKDALKVNNGDENRFFFIQIYKNENEDELIIKLKDNAGGIPEGVIERIFEPYFTTKHEAQGTGLGLHMTFNLIVDGMNGTIIATNEEYVYNNQEQKGALFTITIPTK